MSDTAARMKALRAATNVQEVDPEEALETLAKAMRHAGCLCVYSRCSVHGESMGILARSFIALSNAVDALRLCIQFGIDEDDQVWIAADPRGVGRAADFLGIDAMFVRAQKEASGV